MPYRERFKANHDGSEDYGISDEEIAEIDADPFEPTPYEGMERDEALDALTQMHNEILNLDNVIARIDVALAG